MEVFIILLVTLGIHIQSKHHNIVIFIDQLNSSEYCKLHGY